MQETKSPDTVYPIIASPVPVASPSGQPANEPTQLRTRRVPFALYSEFDNVQEIATGSYKTVYKAVWRDPITADGLLNASDGRNQTVAICVLRNEAHISQEAWVFDELGRHEHLTQLLALTVNNQNLTCLVTEYAPRGGLDEVVIYCQENNLSVANEVLITICMQTSLAMQYLGENNLVHGDLAARNVLVFEFDRLLATQVLVKLSDYGEYRFVDGRYMYIYIYIHNRGI